MKLSKETIDVFKNFAQISPGILITPGNRLKIMGPNGRVIAIATIPETFNEQVSLYDLPQFLNVLSMFEDPKLEFNGRQALIRQGSTTVNYTYADPLGITKVPDEIRMPETLEKFLLSAETLKSLRKAVGVMGLPHICIKGNGSTVQLIGTDKEKSSSNNYTVDIADTSATFEAVFVIDQFTQLEFAYLVEVSKNGPTRFKAQLDPAYPIQSLDYWIPYQPKFSKFNG